MIWHNYILQKLDTLYLHPDAVEEREVILKRLWKESRSPTPTFAGTTLMTLQRLHESRPEVVDAAKLAKHAKWVAERNSYSNSDRLSALHVLATLDFDTAAIIARIWLQEKAQPSPPAAIAAKKQIPISNNGVFTLRRSSAKCCRRDCEETDRIVVVLRYVRLQSAEQHGSIEQYDIW